MTAKLTSLDLIEIASPCPVAWDDMQGDERVRFCGQCQRHVYNIREMTRDEAAAFVRSREGRTCIQFYRRDDGTVMTKDCPIGLAEIKRRFYRSLAAIAGLLAALVSGSLFGRAIDDRLAQRLRTPLQSFAHWIDPTPPPMLGGAMCIPLVGTGSAPFNAAADATNPADSPPTED